MIDPTVLEKLYTNTTPFGLLSNEDQKLFVSHTNTGDWTYWVTREWYRYPGYKPNWNNVVVYRLERPKPIPPSIDWEAVDSKWNWLAVDKDEIAHLYQARPSISGSEVMWVTNSGWKSIDKVFSSFVRGNMPWNETLISRLGVK